MARHQPSRLTRCASVAALALVVGLAAVGCSGRNADNEGTKVELVPQTTGRVGTGASRDAYVGALETNLREETSNAGLFDAAQAACVAPAWIDDITVPELEKSGIAPKDLSEQSDMSAIGLLELPMAKARALQKEAVDCGVDVRAAMLGGDLLANAGSDAHACLQDTLTPAVANDMMAAALTGGVTDPDAATAVNAYQDVLRGCGIQI